VSKIYLLLARASLLLTSISSLSLGAFLVYKKYFLGLIFEQTPYFGFVLVYLLLIAVQAFVQLIIKKPTNESHFLRSFLITLSFALPWFLIYRGVV
jgi:hypothetical protein